MITTTVHAFLVRLVIVVVVGTTVSWNYCSTFNLTELLFPFHPPPPPTTPLPLLLLLILILLLITHQTNKTLFVCLTEPETGSYTRTDTSRSRTGSLLCTHLWLKIIIVVIIYKLTLIRHIKKQSQLWTKYRQGNRSIRLFPHDRQLGLHLCQPSEE